MNTTLRYVKQLYAKFGDLSDRELGDLLGVTAMSAWRYRTGNKGFADDVAIRAAQLLDIDGAKILLDLQQERAPSEEARAVWKGLALNLQSSRNLYLPTPRKILMLRVANPQNGASRNAVSHAPNVRKLIDRVVPRQIHLHQLCLGVRIDLPRCSPTLSA